MANALLKHATSVDIWCSAPRKFFRQLDVGVPVHLIPAPVAVVARLTRHNFSDAWHLPEIVWWDRTVAIMMPRTDLVIGFATQSLATGRGAKRRGTRFVLDRACPHVDFQQSLIEVESEKTGARFKPQPAWFRERQLAEYDIADMIVVPSRYSAETFPSHQQSKIVIAPLLGRVRTDEALPRSRRETFTVGVLGGHPLRKGYLYLLEAWKKLSLPNARLLIRSSSDFSAYPKLAELLAASANVEILEYIPDIAKFYQKCDVFILPSMDDGFGMALFEAMASGVASIATRNCGASELVTDGVDGLVIDAGAVDQLAESILHLYENIEQRESIGMSGQTTVKRIASAGLYEKALLSILTPGEN